ncbi:MAG TPA: toprim domain-containing protein [Thermoanaerobaculia bacterium]|jgi:5S rRNA maturation endonuclease (ribonuclease M5)
MLDVLARYKVELRARNQYKREGECPLPQHGNRDGKPSFHADYTRSERAGGYVWVWACHEPACIEARRRPKQKEKKGGDLIEFVAFMEKCALREAGVLLESWYGPFDGSAAPPPPQKAPASAAPAAEGVNPPLRFELKDGDYRHPYLVGRGFEEEECRYLDVAFHPGKGSMEGRIRFAIHNAEGQLTGYAGRLVDDSAITDENPRWKYPAGFKRGCDLYNLHRVEGDTVVVVESQWGVMACVRAGIMNSVAIMSNEATSEQVKKLATFRKVIVCLDGDRYGRDGGRRLVEKLVAAEVEDVELKLLAENVQPDHLKPDTLRACLGFTREPEGTLELTPEGLAAVNS